MEAHERTLMELFRFDIRYEMPESQREYVWDLKGRWEPLWNDIRPTVEAHLQRRDKPHFLGPLAVKELATEGQLAGNVVTKSVIDGQQRLTTLQLAVNAARVVTAEYHPPTAKALHPFVFNNTASWPNGNQDYQYKIWSRASESNRRAFIQAMGEENTTQSHLEANDESAIINAHRFFARRIRSWIKAKAKGRREECCEALRHTLLGLLTVIIIDIGKDDDARLIYETLNGRGTSLLQSDLVKNRLMEPEVAEVASWPFDDAWWNETPEDEQQRRSRADVLLGHWITMRSREFIRPTEIFESYREYEETARNTRKREILRDIEEMAGIYRSFVHEDPDAMRLIGLASADIVPLIMWLRANKEGVRSDNQWLKGWFALTSFVARRRMTGQDTTGDGFRKIIETILRDVRADLNVPDPADRIVTSLKNLVNKRTAEWPDDSTLRRSFLNGDIYNDPGREVTRDILLMLERGIPLVQSNDARSVPTSYLVQLLIGDNGRKTPDTVSSIEHIMPRAWDGEYWRTSLDEKIEDSRRRNRSLHTIGNLTLVTPELNSRLSNNGWRNKQILIADEGGDDESKKLLMNQQLIQQSPERWDVEEIDNRASYLFEVARRIWPGPNSTLWR